MSSISANDEDQGSQKPVYYGPGYGGPSYGDPELDSGFALTDIIGLLRRHWELVSICVAIGTCAATVLGFQLPVMYEATAKLLIEADQRVVDLDTVVQGVGSDAAAIETQLNLLKSHELIAGFVNSEHFDVDDGAATSREIERMKDLVASEPKTINTALPFAPSEYSQRKNVNPPAYADRVDAIAHGLTVAQEGRSFIINVGFTSTDPEEAARTANGLASYYIQEQAKRRRNITGKASSFLEERLKQLEAELVTNEEAVHRYRAENPTSASNDISVAGEQLADVSSILVQTRAERKEKQARLAYIQQLKNQGGDLSALTEVLRSPLMISLWNEEARLRNREAELRLELGANHPRIVALNEERVEIDTRINGEINKIIGNVSNELQVLIEREKSLEEDVERLSDITQKSETSTDYAAIKLRLLEGNAATSRQIFEEFLLRFKQTREQEAIVQANTRVVVSATVPTKPSSPSPLRFAMLGLVGSSAMGVGLAFLRDRVDRKVKNGREIGQVLDVPCLGLVPYLSEKASDNLRFHEYLEAKPASRFAEALRSIYTKMIIGCESGKPPKILQITSSLPDEGKTTFAINLATMLALDGKRILLVDLDLRNPSVHREIDLDGVRTFEPFLRGKQKFDDSMLGKLETGCHVIALKSPAKDPGKLIRSKQLITLLAHLRDRYDFIIIDGPPSLGLSDSKALLSMSDTLLFILRWNYTTVDQAADAIEELKLCKADIAGAVLNMVDLKKQSRYGYTGSSHYAKNSSYYND